MGAVMTDKFCVDCEYERGYEVFHQCVHQDAMYNLNVVTGNRYFDSCENMRKPTGKCGPDAKLFNETISFWKQWVKKSS